MNENHPPKSPQGATKEQEDRSATYEELLKKLNTPESVKHKEDGRKFILDHQWSKSDDEPLGQGGQAFIYMLIGEVKANVVLSSGINAAEESGKKQKLKCAMKSMKHLKTDQLERRKQECDILTFLNHPNVVRYYHYEIAKRSARIYMELMEQSVEDAIKKSGKFDEFRSIRIAVDVLNGLTFVHELGIIHRDIKSSNILLNADGVAKIADFEVCRINQNVDSTQTGTEKTGTIHFMAPEVFNGRYKNKADIWSVGCLMVHMLTGKIPNEHLNQTQTMMSVANKEIPKYELPEGLREDTATLIKSFISVDTEKRPTAVKAIKELKEITRKMKNNQNIHVPSFEKTLKLLKELNVKAEGILGNLIIDKKKKLMVVHYVAEKGMVDVLKELLQEKCNIEVGAHGVKWWVKDAKPIHFAVVNGWLECLKLLIEAGADLNAICSYGYTALHLAAENGKVDCVKALIEAGADLNIQSTSGWTALHVAARNGFVDCVKALIEAGANLNVINSYGYTALHVAAENGFVDCVKALIKGGADVKLKNNVGRTALDVAVEDNKVECVKYLKSVMK